MSTRRTLAVLAVAASLFTGVAAHADDVQGDSSVGQNTGESGVQTVTFNVTNAANDVLMKVAGDCEYDTKGIPNTNDVILYAAGHASVTPNSTHGVPTSVGVRCTFTNPYAPPLVIDTSSPGNSHADVGATRIKMGPFEICIQVSVHFRDDYFVRSNVACRPPISPV